MKRQMYLAACVLAFASLVAARPDPRSNSDCVDDCALDSRDWHEFLECVDDECDASHFWIWPGPVPIPQMCFPVTIEQPYGMGRSRHIDRCALMTRDMTNFAACLNGNSFVVCSH